MKIMVKNGNILVKKPNKNPAYEILAKNSQFVESPSIGKVKYIFRAKKIN